MEIKDSCTTWYDTGNYLSFGEDIHIIDSSKTTDYSWSSLESNEYNHDEDAEYDPNEFLAESKEFRVKEIELFKEME